MYHHILWWRRCVQVVERKRTPAEIREEYERLQREREERRLQQRTNPKVLSVTTASHSFVTVSSFTAFLFQAIVYMQILLNPSQLHFACGSFPHVLCLLFPIVFQSPFLTSSLLRAPSVLVWMQQICLTATMRTLKSYQGEAFLILKSTRCTFPSR